MGNALHCSPVSTLPHVMTALLLLLGSFTLGNSSQLTGEVKHRKVMLKTLCKIQFQSMRFMYYHPLLFQRDFIKQFMNTFFEGSLLPFSINMFYTQFVIFKHGALCNSDVFDNQIQDSDRGWFKIPGGRHKFKIQNAEMELKITKPLYLSHISH